MCRPAETGCLWPATSLMAGRAQGDDMNEMYNMAGLTVSYHALSPLNPCLMERERLYCHRIIRHRDAFAREDAILEATGQTFTAVARERAHVARADSPARLCLLFSRSAQPLRTASHGPTSNHQNRITRNG